MKNLTSLIFLLFATQLVSAQSAKFGIKGGYNHSFIDGGTLPSGVEGITRPGFHVGVFREYAFNKWSVMPSLLYSVKGYRVTVNPPTTPPGVSEKGTQTYNYLELPINLLYNFKIKPGKIFVGAGPYMGYLLAANGKRTTTAYGTETYTETKFGVGGNGQFKRFDFGVNFVTGIALKNGFLFNIAAYKGFTNILATTIPNNPTITKNGALTFSVGHAF
jgi:hypothetical protein